MPVDPNMFMGFPARFVPLPTEARELPTTGRDGNGAEAMNEEFVKPARLAFDSPLMQSAMKLIPVEPPIALADGLAAIVLHPGDVLVLRSNEPTSAVEKQRLANMAKNAGIANHLILDSTTDVFVLRHKPE